MNQINTETKVQDYGTILTALQQIAPHAHIAGGAVRDTLLSREIKDIDVFLDDAHADDAAKLLRATFGYVKVGEWRQYEMFSDPIVARVAKFEKADEIIPVCLIGLKGDYTAKENIGRFDFGICMAAWEGGASMITTDEFKYDAEARTFTLTRADNHAQFAYSMVRFKKLSADRYAGWTLSVPGQFEGLARDYAFSKAWYTHQDIHDSPFGVVFESPQVLRPKER